MRYKATIHLLGLDMSRAFDTINRDKLMTILESIPEITDDDRQLIRILLSNTTLQVQFNGILTAPFQSTIGSPQGDGLSPLLFAIYLEAALRELRERGPKRPELDVILGLPEYAIYADDTDFISTCSVYLDLVQQAVGPIFVEFNLLVNVDKTERTAISKEEDQWKNARKLGSLLGVEEDVDRRIQLALLAFRGLDNLWKHNSRVAVEVRLRAYQSIVESVLLYNCGTWALTVEAAGRLDRAQRRMLRRILGLKWYDKVTIPDLYARSGISPASEQVVYARWRLFGHTLRLNEHTPAREAMSFYFEHDQYEGRSGPTLTVANALSREYKMTTNNTISNRNEFDCMVSLAQNRDEWKELTRNVLDTYRELQNGKAAKSTKRRHGDVNPCIVRNNPRPARNNNTIVSYCSFY